MRSRKLPVLIALLAVLLPAVAAAQLYTVHLHNGAVLETRYPPELASWDESKIVFLSDVGNWISVDRADVAEVVAQIEARGFGKFIDNSTIALGWAPNDAPTAEELAEQAADPTNQLLRFLQAQQENRPNFSVQQFVDPSDAGMANSGLPAFGLTPGFNPLATGGTNFAMGEGGSESVEPVTVDQ